MKKLLSTITNRKHILQFSPPRSGSTLVYNILREVFPRYKVEKCHTLNSRNLASPIVATYRNPVDIVASLLLVSNCSVTDANIREQCILLNTQGIWDLLTIRNRSNLLLLRYEDFVDDFDVLFNGIENHFQIGIPHEKRKRLSTKYSRKSVQAIAERYDDFSQYDSKTQFHGRHISRFNGAPNFARQLLSDEQGNNVARYFSLFMEQMAYNVDDSSFPKPISVDSPASLKPSLDSSST
jgi:hypothetical protein